MKLVLLHGPAISSSRQKLLQIKKKFDPDSIVVFEKGADPKDILDTLMATPLFGENKLVVIENPSENLLILSNIDHLPYTIVMWFDHEIDPKKWLASRSGPQEEILFFPETKEVSVFPFLDYLGNKNQKAFLELDKLKKAGYDSQYIITMIFYLLRSLVAPKKTAPKFVQDKLVKQQKNFTPEVVEKMYKFVLETDFKIKSGLMESQQAEFSLVNLFLH